MARKWRLRVIGLKRFLNQLNDSSKTVRVTLKRSTKTANQVIDNLGKLSVRPRDNDG